MENVGPSLAAGISTDQSWKNYKKEMQASEMH